jgi:cytochrome b
MQDASEPESGPAAARTGKNTMAHVRVWDPLVRVFHWGLVVAFALAWITGDESQGLHNWAGYVAAALIAVRIVWGFVGSPYARFSQFVRGPGVVGAYLGNALRRREARYIGHNPAGAVMILLILVTMSGTAFTGWLMVDPARQAMLPTMPQMIAAAYADDDGDEEGIGSGGEEVLGEVHEVLANLMLLLVALHVGGVVLASFRHHENLARSPATSAPRNQAILPEPPTDPPRSYFLVPD